tara:strand:- start:674 stop:1756 length:1083 start_codon:yes stop_codon:yes gene_type:complete
MIKKKLLIKIILFTTVFLSFYYFYIASRQRYIVKSSIVIRKTSQDNNLDFPSIFSFGNKASLEDARFLKSFLKSPEVYNLYLKKFDFDNQFRRRLPDLTAGISAFDDNDTKYNFFKNLISINFRELSGIVIIRTTAYDPNTSYQLNLFLIEESDKFTNKLNQDIFKKQLNFANNEIKIQYQKLNEATLDLLTFQKRNSTLIPEMEASSSTKLINALENELVKLKVDQAGLQRRFVSKEAPEILDISNQILELSNQIDKEKNALVSPLGKNLNKKLLEFSELKANMKFARDLYIAALTNQEKMRVSSQENQRFLGILSGPKIPSRSYMAWRHRGFLTSIAIITTVYLLVKFFNLIRKNRRD